MESTQLRLFDEDLNPIKTRGRAKKYNSEEERKAANREYQRRWREKNKGYFASYRKEYYKKNREKVLEYNNKWREHSGWNEYMNRYHNETKLGRAINLVGAYRQNDTDRHLGETKVTPAWVVENIFGGQSCYYCGETDWHELGCDRIDNTKPHTPQNVLCCCAECNIKRSRNKTVEEFVQYRQLYPRLESAM